MLITGITGMVGSHLADFLMEHTNWEIYGLCRWRSPLDNIQHLVDDINAKQRIHLVYGDLRDTISIDNAVKEVLPDYVFHLAAQSYPKTSFTAPLDTLDTNIQGTAIQCIAATFTGLGRLYLFLRIIDILHFILHCLIVSIFRMKL